jgi:hypothetical protein
MHSVAAAVVQPQVMRAKNLPGAGQYNTYKAVGKQPLSNKKTLPAHSFGKSTRDASKKSKQLHQAWLNRPVKPNQHPVLPAPPRSQVDRSPQGW